MVNLSGIGSTIATHANKVGSNAYAGYRVLANAAKCGDSFKSKYAKKIVEKAKADFASSPSIKKKTFIAIGAGIAAIGAGIVSLINKGKAKAAPAENQQ